MNFNIMRFIAITCWVDRCFEVEDEVQEALADKRRKLLTGVGVVSAEVLAQRSFIAMTQTGEGSAGKWKEKTVYRVAARRWCAIWTTRWPALLLSRALVLSSQMLPRGSGITAIGVFGQGQDLPEIVAVMATQASMLCSITTK